MRTTSGTGRAAPTNRRITSYDVARAAGVSRSAVSLVLNGRADGVISAENQHAVRAAAKRLGYRPNRVARSLRDRRTHLLGVVTDRAAGFPLLKELQQAGGLSSEQFGLRSGLLFGAFFPAGTFFLLLWFRKYGNYRETGGQ